MKIKETIIRGWEYFSVLVFVFCILFLILAVFFNVVGIGFSSIVMIALFGLSLVLSFLITPVLLSFLRPIFFIKFQYNIMILKNIKNHILYSTIYSTIKKDKWLCVLCIIIFLGSCLFTYAAIDTFPEKHLNIYDLDSGGCYIPQHFVFQQGSWKSNPYCDIGSLDIVDEIYGDRHCFQVNVAKTQYATPLYAASATMIIFAVLYLIAIYGLLKSKPWRDKFVLASSIGICISTLIIRWLIKIPRTFFISDENCELNVVTTSSDILSILSICSILILAIIVHYIHSERGKKNFNKRSQENQRRDNPEMIQNIKNLREEIREKEKLANRLEHELEAKRYNEQGTKPIKKKGIMEEFYGQESTEIERLKNLREEIEVIKKELEGMEISQDEKKCGNIMHELYRQEKKKE